MARLTCIIIVSGELSDRYDGVFDNLTLMRVCGTTELRGDIADQSAFQGVLRQVGDLGLEIVSVSASSE